MTQSKPKARSVVHGTVALERSYPVARERVFAAWSKAESKRRWFACHDEWTLEAYELDFRPGGSERVATREPDGTLHEMRARYHEIVENERFIYAYDMYLGDTLISVSLVTVELRAEKGSTVLVFHEQGAFLDGTCTRESREEGTRIGLSNLARWLEQS